MKKKTELELRRAEILAEYRFHGLDPVRIAREPISLELALLLRLIVPIDEMPAASST
jgi:hypothetical protein